jgi:hypothetical protein
MKYYSREEFTRDLRIFPYHDALLYPRWPLLVKQKHDEAARTRDDKAEFTHRDVERGIADGLTVRSKAFRAAFAKLASWIAAPVREYFRIARKRQRIAATKRQLHRLPTRILYDIGVHPGNIDALAHGLENGKTEDREYWTRH